MERLQHEEDLDIRLSKWASEEMGLQIEPRVFQQLFLVQSTGMSKSFEYIVRHVKAVTLIDSVFTGNSTEIEDENLELLSEYKSILQREDSLYLQILDLENDIEKFHAKLIPNVEEIRMAERVLQEHLPRSYIIKAWELCLVNILAEMNALQTQLDLTLCTRSPKNTAPLDTEEILHCLIEFHKLLPSSGEESKQRKLIHLKVKKILNFFNMEQIFEKLIEEIRLNECEFKELNSKGAGDFISCVCCNSMAECISTLQTVHTDCYMECLDIKNLIQSLKTMQLQLVENLRREIKDHPSYLQLEYLLNLEQDIAQKQAAIDVILECVTPKSMRSIFKADLDSLQQKIRAKESAVILLHQHIMTVIQTNKVMASFNKTTEENSDKRDEFLESRHNAEAQMKEFENSMLKMKDAIVRLKPALGPDLNDLCVRPGKQSLMPLSVKNRLLSAIDMPQEQAPETLLSHLRMKIEANNNSAHVLKMQEELLGILQSSIPHKKLEKLLNIILSCGKATSSLVPKAYSVIETIHSDTIIEDLKEHLTGFLEEPAFSIVN